MTRRSITGRMTRRSRRSSRRSRMRRSRITNEDALRGRDDNDEETEVQECFDAEHEVTGERKRCPHVC